MKQEVVPLHNPIAQSLSLYTVDVEPALEPVREAVIRLTLYGVQMEITNAAASETITKTLAALQSLS